MDRAPFLTILGLAISVCADEPTVQIEPQIYTGIRSLLVTERAREGQSLLVSDIDCIRTRNNEMMYDFMRR